MGDRRKEEKSEGVKYKVSYGRREYGREERRKENIQSDREIERQRYNKRTETNKSNI